MNTKTIILKSKTTADKFYSECRKAGIITDRVSNKEVIVYVLNKDNVDRLSDKILKEIGENYLVCKE